jgi:hypothetical protein
MVKLSSSALAAMGFRRLAQGEAVVATFESVHAYEVRGFILEDGEPLVATGSIAGAPYGISLGRTINATSKALSGEDFADDEKAWEREQKSTPPYLLVRCGATGEHSCSEGFINQGSSEEIETHDCFAAARAEVRAFEQRVLPPLIAALSSTFGTPEHRVHFRSLGSVFLGRTGGRLVRDIRFEATISGYTSKTVGADEARENLDHVVRLASELDPKVAKFFTRGSEEGDPLKRFLFFFLAIEIETHAVFQSIDHIAHMKEFASRSEGIRESALRFLGSQPEKWTGVADRFVWAAMCAWTHLDDSDINTFKRLKRIRNDIAHGSIDVPPSDAVAAVERLALKLQPGRPGA